MIKQDAAKYTDFCHHIEGYGGFSPWLDEYDPLTEKGFAFVHGGSEDNGQFGLGDIDLNFGTTEFSYKDILEKVKAYRDECKGSMDPDFPEECDYVDELDDLVRAIQDWCDKDESKKSEGVEALKDKVVSDGTLKPEDLIPKFLNALKHDETAHSKFLKDYPEILEIQSWDDVDDETKSMLVDELTDALNGIAPEGYFFGASEGDGACFGFWKVDPDESKKSESSDALKKVVDAASAALNNYDSDNVDVIKDEETGELVVMFHSTKTSHPITNTGVYADDVDLSQLEKELDKLTVGYVFESKKPESKKPESKKSEGVGGKIKMGIDYNMFMRMCASAAYLDNNEDYWDALWEYYSEMGEIEDACEFFDNLFQYTDWADEERVYDEMLDDKYKDENKSKGECIQAAIDEGDLDAYKSDKGMYLVIQ